MIKDKIKELAALCKRWDELVTQQNEVKAQIEKLIAPPETSDRTPISSLPAVAVPCSPMISIFPG